MNIEIKISKKPVNYEKAIKYMEKRLNDILFKNAKDLIWILEHEPIFTAGTSYSKNDIIDKSIKIEKLMAASLAFGFGFGIKRIKLVSIRAPKRCRGRKFRH